MEGKELGEPATLWSCPLKLLAVLCSSLLSSYNTPVWPYAPARSPILLQGSKGPGFLFNCLVHSVVRDAIQPALLWSSMACKFSLPTTASHNIHVTSFTSQFTSCNHSLHFLEKVVEINQVSVFLPAACVVSFFDFLWGMQIKAFLGKPNTSS